MPDSGSKLEDKTNYELEKQRLRFNGWEGQMHGSSKTGPSDFIPKAIGTWAYPVHVGRQED